MPQGWSKIFNRINWLNRPSTNTPLNATNLNAGDSAIDKLDDRIITLDTVKADMQVVNGMVADISVNDADGVITVTYKNGSTKTYDTNLEKIATNFTYDYSTQRLVLTLSDGSKQYVDMSALITQYEFKDSTTIAFSVDSTGKVSASVKNGSITDAMLETGYLANIKVEVAKAEASASQAQSSEASSDYNAKLSRSYAIGGSGIREGEDTDNAMYYYEQAKKTDIGQIRSDVDELNSNLSQLEIDLKMLGWTVPKEMQVQNYVDSDGVYHQIVGRVDLGTLNWIYETELNRFVALLPGKFKPSNQNEWARGLYCVLYDANISPITGYKVDMTISGYPNTMNLYLYNFSYTDTTTFKNAMQGVYLYYELETPITMTIDGNEAVTKLKNDLCGLSFSVSGTTLSITDGTNTWTLSN